MLLIKAANKQTTKTKQIKEKSEVPPLLLRRNGKDKSHVKSGNQALSTSKNDRWYGKYFMGFIAAKRCSDLQGSQLEAAEHYSCETALQREKFASMHNNITS